MDVLRPFAVIDASSVELEVETVPDDQSVRGEPTTGWRSLGTTLGLEVGVWEMSTGAMTDIEVDEIFVVISGEATVTLIVDEQPTEVIDLRPGSICRLPEGAHTLWEVTRTVRKVVLLRAGEQDAGA